MFSKKSLIPAVAIAFLGSQGADAADMPWTSDDHIRNVIEQCFTEGEVSDEDCSLAMAWSSRDMASNYFDALVKANTPESEHATSLVFNACSPVASTYDWENFPVEMTNDCTGAILTAKESGVEPAEVPYDIMSLGVMVRDGMPTANGILKKSLSEYSQAKGWTYEINY